jgi:hypothetical protein
MLMPFTITVWACTLGLHPSGHDPQIRGAPQQEVFAYTQFDCLWQIVSYIGNDAKESNPSFSFYKPHEHWETNTAHKPTLPIIASSTNTCFHHIC